MPAPRAPIFSDTVEHPLRVALARGDARLSESLPALRHIIAAGDNALINEAVVAQVGGMLAHLAVQLFEAGLVAPDSPDAHALTHERLLLMDPLRAHCHALALEWRLIAQIEEELAADPVLSPLLRSLVADANPAIGALAMAAIASQARFVQAQRRMELPLAELPAELFHAILLTARDIGAGNRADDENPAETRLRAGYKEGECRLALLTRLATLADNIPTPMPLIEEAGVSLWLSILSTRSGETREKTACAVADPLLGRLLLTLRAAGVAPPDAERQALRAQPDARLPEGLQDIGTREAAQWLAEARV